MTSFLKIFGAILVVFSTAQAIENLPQSEVKEKVSDIQGAVKVEEKHMIKLDENGQDINSAPTETKVPDQVQQTDSSANPPAPAQPTSDLSSGSHLFGLHASAGLPHPINFGLNYVMPSRLFSIELSTGQFSLKASGVDMKIENSEIGLRWHPFSGSFFVGSLFGTQKVTGQKTETISNVSVNGNLEIKSNYMTPEFGWMWGADDGGFFAMFELGYQSPSSVTSTFTDDSPTIVQSTSDYTNFVKDLTDQAEKYGKIGLPHIALLKFGWLF